MANWYASVGSQVGSYYDHYYNQYGCFRNRLAAKVSQKYRLPVSLLFDMDEDRRNSFLSQGNSQGTRIVASPADEAVRQQQVKFGSLQNVPIPNRGDLDVGRIAEIIL